MEPPPDDKTLCDWQVLALRPAADCAPLRRALRREGARLHCAAPWRIELLTPPAEALRRALARRLWLVTSPNAVRGLVGVTALARFPGSLLAVGPGTAEALRRAGARRVACPEHRHDSEGLLAMPELDAAHAAALVTGVGGRGMLDRVLAERGVELQRLEVYRRLPRRWGAGALSRLSRLPEPRALLLGSVEALGLGGPPLAATLRGYRVIAASERVAAAATAAGLEVVTVAGSARPQALLAALKRHAKRLAIR